MEDAAPQAAEHIGKILVAEDFEPHVGKLFRFRGTRFAFPLTKIMLGPLQEPSEWVRRRGFVLLFRTPKEQEWMPEGAYVCDIADGPNHEVYVTPIHTPDPRYQDYQAVFN
ncbi:MAG TPA: hypothetical protein VK446_05760 [Methylocystis sp.]|nr:hypothetical protein [Methylocystis sp.]